jgi:hypothetical protein
MPNLERVTVSLPANMLKHIDRREKNRGKFIAEAVRRELDRLRRAELQRSLDHPHPESAVLAGQEIAEWSRGLPDEDSESLVDFGAGKAGRWVPGKGWQEDRW